MNRVKFFSDCVILAIQNGWTAYGLACPENKIITANGSHLKEDILLLNPDFDPIFVVMKGTIIIKIISYKEILFSHSFILALIGGGKLGDEFLYLELLKMMVVESDPLTALYRYMQTKTDHLKTIPNED